MNILKFLDSLSDPEALKTPVSRRTGFKSLAKKGKDLALVSIPFALAATSKKTAAATMAMSSAAYQATPTEILQFALTLEYLERDFYQMGLNSNVIPQADKDVFGLIRDHEESHVTFLLAALGNDAFAAPAFNFTAGGLVDPFNNYDQFLALAQGFEDTGVRAYKGQAGALIDNNVLLEYALQIHSVEARHASQIRRMREEKGWITGNMNTLPPDFSAIYAGEENTVQLGVDLSGKFENFGGDKAVTEAFDEPLTMAEVNAIASLFLA